MIDMASVLMDVVNLYPNNLAGTAFSSDDQFVEVYAKDAEGPGVDVIAQLVEEQGLAGKVVIVPTAYSMDDLNAAEAAISQEWGDELSIGIDFVSNALIVSPNSSQVEEEFPFMEKSALPLEEIVSMEDVRKDGDISLGEEVGELPVVVEPYAPIENSGRNNDTSPFIMGGRIVGKEKNETCSLGIPISYANKFMVLTAGHCSSSNFYTKKYDFSNTKNNGAFVGTQYTTSYPGKASSYGDWKLLSGKNYWLSIWDTAAGSTKYSALAISAANWTSMTVGSQLCTSGQTTGQVCRYRVTVSKTSRKDAAGVNVGMLTEMSHQGVSGVNDKNGTRDGDSGGPVYYRNSAGKIVVVGIVKGASGDSLKYWFVRLEGLKKWKSSVALG